MKNKKLIIAIVLCVAGLLSLIYGATSTTRGKKNARRAKASSPAKKAVPAEKIVPKKRHAKKTKFTEWGRSPFTPKGGAAGVPSSKIVLGGIMWVEENPRAIINNNIVAIGDEIGGNKVIDIKKDRVVLSDGTEKLTLKLEVQDFTPKKSVKKKKRNL